MAKDILIKSTSGIRGIVGKGIYPFVVMDYSMAFGTFLRKGTVVVGRDTRPSGIFYIGMVVGSLQSVGINVIDLGVVPTPTIGIAIKRFKAVGGICVTASHNPSQWNALKFFNNKGEFISPAQYKMLNSIYESRKFNDQLFDKLGSYKTDENFIDIHIKQILSLKTIPLRKIKSNKYKVVLDAINGAGSFALPKLLREMGCKVIEINCKGDGNFVHEPEPVAKNLTQLSRAVKKHRADIGLACDPDADRLAIVNEKGIPIGEELTLAIAVDYILGKKKSVAVINLSTSNVTADLIRKSGSRLYYSKVGESNVVLEMKKRKAVIGGEGNGGVIYPTSHAGRDSLVAAAFVLSSLTFNKMKISELVETYNVYYNIKIKSNLPVGFAGRIKGLEKKIIAITGKSKIDRKDGIRINFKGGWVQIRTSNTEPIYRLIIETTDSSLTLKLKSEIMKLLK